jgi:FAD-dependent urate hydroxylase
MPDPTPPIGLDALERQLRLDLALMCYPPRPWVPARRTPSDAPILDVLIIGGGQGGLNAAFVLMRERIERLLVIDDQPPGSAGPWLNFARMITLRTPNHLTGPDDGLPNLTFQRWYEAQHGDGAYALLGLIPKESWAAYLAWYQRVLNIPVMHSARAGAIRFDDAAGCLAVPVSTPDGEQVLFARKVVLATGIDGSGAWDVPAVVRDHLPKRLWAHTREAIDFEALRGKRLGILGAGASSFDNASVALEAGAAGAEIFFRRATLPCINPYRWAEFVGFLKHHGDMPDPVRWRFISQIIRMGQLPPHDTYLRAKALPGFRLHPACPWLGAREEDGQAVVTTPDGEHRFDYLILGTGFTTDVARRPELANLHPHVALWSDRFTPPVDDPNPQLLAHPYLDPHFAFTEKHPGAAPWISSVYNYTFGCLLSLGFGGASISGMKYGSRRLAYGITRALYAEDADLHYDALCRFDIKEFSL